MTDASHTPDAPGAWQPLPEGRLQGRLLFADLGYLICRGSAFKAPRQ